MNIVLVYYALPKTVHACTRANEDGSYTILINDSLCRERQIKAVLHELTHINGNDFSSDVQATLLEKMLHGQTEPALDLSVFEFFTACASF